MKTYEAVFDVNEVAGVYAISLVESPAMEGTFIALKKDEIQLKEIDKEQRILLGLVLEPNKPIYRNQNGEEFNIVFSEQTIKDLSYNFFKQNHQRNSTIEHDAKQRIEGVTFVESWIVEDSEKDKSALYGFSYPKGSWIATMKVDSPEVWDNYVKTGKVKGFSIDAMLELKEVNLKSEIDMSNQIVDAITKGFEMVFSKKQEEESEVEVKLGSVNSKDGSVAFEYDGETLEVGANVWVMMPDGEKMPLPVGEHETEDGKVIVVAEDGIIAEVKDAMQPEEEPAPAQMAQPENKISEEQAGQIAQAVKSVLIKYSEEQDAKMEILKTQLAEMSEKLVKLSEQPASKPIKAQPTQVDFSKMTKKERLFNKIQELK